MGIKPMIPSLLGDCAVDEWTIAHALDFLADALPDMIARDGRRRELGNLVTL